MVICWIDKDQCNVKICFFFDSEPDADKFRHVFSRYIITELNKNRVSRWESNSYLYIPPVRALIYKYQNGL